MSELHELWYVPSADTFYLLKSDASLPAGQASARDAFGALAQVELSALEPLSCSHDVAQALLLPYISALNDETLAVASELFGAPHEVASLDERALMALTADALLERCVASPLQRAQLIRALARLYTQRSAVRWMRALDEAPSPLLARLRELASTLNTLATALERVAHNPSSPLARLLDHMPWFGRRAASSQVKALLYRSFPSLIMDLHLLSREVALKRRVRDALSPLDLAFPELP